MKIGVWINNDYQATVGGGFSYYERLIKAIDGFAFDNALDICFVTEKDTPLHLRREVVHLTARPRASVLQRIKKHLPLIGRQFSMELTNLLFSQKMSIYRQLLVENGIKILYYPTSGCVIPNFPFIATNWDIGHLSTYAFPEVCMDGQFETRNKYYTTVLPKALLTFCESEAGKRELLEFTPIKEDKLRVVPLFAGGCVDETVDETRQREILTDYHLQSRRFFFYPAQFWAHKNHYGLIRAFKHFVQEHPEFRLVLTGSDKGNLAYVKRLISENSLLEKVIFPGFVSLETIYTFYRNAVSLVMPSFFGPTNMPPLEAMALGCPVICTDLTGHKEELGDAALYFDARNVESIYNSMEKVVESNDLYRERIIMQQDNTVFKLETALNRINRFFIEASEIRATWD